MPSDSMPRDTKSAAPRVWELQDNPAQNELVVVFRGYLTRAEGLASAAAFAGALQRGPALVMWDVREMEGYDSSAMSAWATQLRPLRQNVRGVRLLGGNAVIRTGARVLASLMGMNLTLEDQPEQRAANLEAQRLGSSGDLVILASKQLVVVDTPRMPTPAHLETLTELLQKHANALRRPFGVVNVMAPRMGVVVSEETRAAAFKLGLAMNKFVACHVLLVLGDGVYGSWARSLAGGIKGTLRIPYPTLVCSSPREASEFLAAKLADAGEERHYQQLIEQTIRHSAAA